MVLGHARVRLERLANGLVGQLDLAASSLTEPARTAFIDGGKVHLGIRPHQIRVGGAASENSVGLRGKVVSNQWLGDQTHIGLDVGGAMMIVVSDASIEATLDSELTVHIPLSRLHVFDGESERALLHGVGE